MSTIQFKITTHENKQEDMTQSRQKQSKESLESNMNDETTDRKVKMLL